MKRATLFLTLALVLAGCKFGSFSGKTGSGNMKVEKRTVPAFTSVNISGAYDVEIVAQKEQSVEIEGDDNLLPLIKTEVKNGVLEIGNSQSISTKRNLRVRISVPKLDAISTSGASDIVITGVKSDEFNIESSGASNLKMSGEAKSIVIKTSGAGEIDAKDLRAEKVNITSTGAATADVYASEELRASVSGAGDVNYYGNPKTVSEDKNGAGSITKR
ncbi:MAG: hypothetical protein DMF68_20530 [Acidobacteria bacterium]|nr:MAG: hypothetical protein DMF68_20530 [Acidobacteriota bacterium]